MKLALALIPLAGCAQLLGLDDTRFDQKDAMVDAKSVCDGVMAQCVSSSGRSVCGQLVDTGTMAGVAVRAPGFTATTCVAPLAADGPCALSVYGQPVASYFAGTSTDRVAGVIDDCGRFAIPDVPATNADIAVVFDGAPIVESTTLLLGRATTPGEVDSGVAATIVRTATESMWAQQIDSANPPGLTGSFIISYATTSSDPIKARVDGGGLQAVPTQPWGAYFTGRPFEAIDKTQLATLPTSSTVLVVPASGMHTVDGSRPGKTCSSAMIQAVGGAVIHITLKC